MKFIWVWRARHHSLVSYTHQVLELQMVMPEPDLRIESKRPAPLIEAPT